MAKRYRERATLHPSVLLENVYPSPAIIEVEGILRIAAARLPYTFGLIV